MAYHDDVNVLVDSLKARPAKFVSGFRHKFPANSCPLHCHSHFELVYHVEGEGVNGFEDGTCARFDKGDVIIHPPGVKHSQTMDTAGEDACIKLAVGDTSSQLQSKYLRVAKIDDPYLVDEFDRLTSGRVPPIGPQSEILDHRATAVMLQLLLTVRDTASSSRLSSASQYAMQARQYINEHYQTIRGMEDVAAHVGISADYLRHQFKNTFGMGMSRWLTHVRMERAKNLLVHAEMPIKMIATLCGYQDVHYFTAVFREAAGVSPGRYRRRKSPGVAA